MANPFLPQQDYDLYHVLDNNGVSANAVAVDTGQLDAGSYEIRAAIDGNCSQAARFIFLVIRNAANDAVVKTLRCQNCYFAAAKSPIHFERIRIEENERIAWQMGSENYTDILAADIAIRRVA